MDRERDRDDDPVTIRDIYTLVQQLNQRSTTLVTQVGTLTERAQEDRNRMLDLAADIQKLKIKVYSVGAAVILLSTMLMLVERLSSVSGGA
jgi:hypothetical protein